MNATQLQIWLEQHSSLYQPDEWPGWLLACAVAWLGLCLGLGIHGWLRYRRHPSIVWGEEQISYLYPLYIRLWHQVNALLFLFLLIGGFITHFALMSHAVIVWLVSAHQYVGWLLLGLWCAFVIINLVSANGANYRIVFSGMLSRCQRQARFYLTDIYQGAPHPFHAVYGQKFNPLQQVGYCCVMYGLVPLLLLSGLLLLNPQWLPVGMAYWVLKFHLLCAVGGLFFLPAHIYLCTTGDTPGQAFLSMVDGWHRCRQRKIHPPDSTL